MAEQTEQVVTASQMLRIREVMSDEPGCASLQSKDSSDAPFKLLVTLFANQTTQELSIDMNVGENYWDLKTKIANTAGLTKDYLRIFGSRKHMEEGKQHYMWKKVKTSPDPLLAVYDPNRFEQDLFLSDEEEEGMIAVEVTYGPYEADDERPHRTVTLMVKHNITVLELMEKVDELIEWIPGELPGLVLDDGNVFLEDEHTLSDYNIQHSCKLHVVPL